MFWKKKKSATDELIDAIEDKIINNVNGWMWVTKEKAFLYGNIWLYMRPGQWTNDAWVPTIDIGINGGRLDLTGAQRERVHGLIETLKALKGLIHIYNIHNATT